MDEFLGIIKLFAGNFAPRGYMLCEGQYLSVVQHNALFAVLQTTYGGDGRTNFRLPDLRGRMVVGASDGPGPGLSRRDVGELVGVEAVTLTAAQLPSHVHAINMAPASLTVKIPTYAADGALLDDSGSGDFGLGTGVGVGPVIYADASTPPAGHLPPVTVAGALPAQTGAIGGSTPVPLMPPSMGMRYIICVEGLFPSRD